MTIVIFIIVLSILVFVHELGHFIMAKRAGMKVEEFGFGFPPRIWGIKKGETTYSINLIPFGGFVKILGEDGQERNDPRSFGSKSFLQRASVLLAGVVMNFLLAVVLLVIVNAVGIRIGLVGTEDATQVSHVKVQVVEVRAGSPAEKAGIRALDEIVRVKAKDANQDIHSVSEVQDFTAKHLGQEVTITIAEGATQKDITVVPRANAPAGEGALGIAMALTGVVKYSLPQAFVHGVTYSAILLINTVQGYATVITNLVTTGKAGVQLSGPIGIAQITGQAARFGFIYLLQFMALISINLAVLNSIPFPAIDGGRFLFLIIEKIKGSPISPKFENTANATGFVLLLLLMAYVTTKDIIKLF